MLQGIVKQKSIRNKIIVHSIWGNTNVALRYITGFIATSLIAAKIDPTYFGIYQLILTHLMIIEALLPVNQNHLQNFIIQKVENQNTAVNVWFLQIFGLWFIASIFCIIIYFFAEADIFWLLLLLACLKLPFRALDIVQIIAESKQQNIISQQIQMSSQLSFNLSRILVALFIPNLLFLVLCNLAQGLITSFHQLRKWVQLDIQVKLEPSFRSLWEISKSNAGLVIVGLLAILQQKLFSIILSDKLHPEEYGNYQLIIKLIEPATALGAIIFAANYTVLANTLKNNKNIFRPRFLKVSMLSIFLSVFSMFCVYIVPKELLLDILGHNYELAISNLNFGSLMILSSTILNVATQYFTLNQRYNLIAGINLCIIVSLVGLVDYFSKFNLHIILLAQILIPVAVMLIVCLFYYLIKFMRASDVK